MEGEEAGGSLELAGYQPSSRSSKKHCLGGKGWRMTTGYHRLPLSSTYTFQCEHPPTHAPVFHTTHSTYTHTLTLVIVTWYQRTTMRLKWWNKCVYKQKNPAKYWILWPLFRSFLKHHSWIQLSGDDGINFSQILELYKRIYKWQT